MTRRTPFHERLEGIGVDGEAGREPLDDAADARRVRLAEHRDRESVAEGVLFQ
jgi:hypothetical protein